MPHVSNPQDSHENLLERILSRENRQRAYKRGKETDGAPGVDKMTVAELPDFLRKHWQEIRESLMDGTYQPSPVLRAAIPNPTGGPRVLGIPTVLDRVIQQAIAQVLTEIVAPEFSEFRDGFRPGRSAHDAVYNVREYLCQGDCIAVDMDLAKFFDTVNHDVLMCRVARKIHDKRVRRLLGKYLRAGVCVNGRLQATPKGVPQGGPRSPLWSNVLLDEYEKELERRKHKFVRYADDRVIFVKSGRAGNRVLQSIRRFLEKTLKLTSNEAKSSVGATAQLEY